MPVTYTLPAASTAMPLAEVRPLGSPGTWNRGGLTAGIRLQQRLPSNWMNWAEVDQRESRQAGGAVKYTLPA